MNFRDGQPIYLQIAERLMDEILAGQYSADERVPGVRDYSALLQVNVNTRLRLSTYWCRKVFSTTNAA